MKGATIDEGLRVVEWMVSIHAPREGRDKTWRRTVGQAAQFQSTRPVKGATRAAAMFASVSIHAPREGRDAANNAVTDEEFKFQSTRPVKGATRRDLGSQIVLVVSIHAPREGRDAGNAPICV